MPLANEYCFIPSVLHLPNAGGAIDSCEVAGVVAEHPALKGLKSAQQNAPAGSTLRTGGNRIFEVNPAVGQLVQIWRLHVRIASKLSTQIMVIVAQDKNNIGPVACLAGSNGTAQGAKESPPR